MAHQEQRNFCEVCDQVHPDVELYKHRNPTTEAEWICVRCADQLQIADTFRRTAQSHASRICAATQNQCHCSRCRYQTKADE